MKKIFLFLFFFFITFINVYAEEYVTKILIDDKELSEFSSEKYDYQNSRRIL